jgi:hypothetical protein
MKRVCCALSLAALFIMACETIPDTTQLELQKDKIRSVAVLPLVVGDAGKKVLAGLGAENEIAGFMAYWKDNFIPSFKARIKLLEGIEVKYAGEDFIKAVPTTVDYGQLMDELGVDAVIGFNLVRYNEAEPVTGIALTLIGMKENALAELNVHFYYLRLEDWSPRVEHEEYGVAMGSQMRGTFMMEVLDWLDMHWPLSVNFKSSSEKAK